MNRLSALTNHLRKCDFSRRGDGVTLEETGAAVDSRLGVNRDQLRERRTDPNGLRTLMRPKPVFDVQEMKWWLDNNNHEMRDEFRKFLSDDDIFQQRYNISLAETRALALQRLRRVCEVPGRFISVYDFRTNPQRVFAAHELACLVDGSLATKITVQYNLFGGTVLKLGTTRHTFVLEKIDSVEYCGCFCLTELGYGNNAVKLETTATYDDASKEFVIHTPSPNAAKFWITNGALDAHYAVVFAQTIVHGKNEGVCGFLVQVRTTDKSHKAMPGVTIRDMGYKQGQNGVDNALISFDHVRIPREAILNQRVDVDGQGNFVSDIKSPRGRFLVALNQLYSGRLCLASKAVGRAKQALTIAIRYSWSRLSTGPTGESDYPIMGFQLQERALIPELARTYVLSGFGMNLVKSRYAKETTVDGTGLGQLEAETMVLCSGIKALVTASAERTISICRERCGGAGYSRANVFSEALADAHAVMTAEGDNKVLLQKTAKEALGFYESGKLSLAPLHEVFQGFAEFSNIHFILHLFKQREALLVTELQGKMDRETASGAPFFDTWVLQLSDQVQALAVAYLERVVLQQFVEELSHMNKSIRSTLEKLGLLFGMQSLEVNMPVFLSLDLMDSYKTRLMLETSRKICHELSEQSLHLVDAFAIPEKLLPPAARDWIRWNSQDHKGEVLGFEY